MEKKIYEAPEVEVLKLGMYQSLLESSPIMGGEPPFEGGDAPEPINDELP